MHKLATYTYQTATSVIPRVTINWLDRELPDPNDQREYARQRVVLAVTEAIADAMESAGMRRSDIAEKLGKSKSQISQVLSGRRNMTLHTLGDVLWACGFELDDLIVTPLGSVSCPIDGAWEWHHQAGTLIESLSMPIAVAVQSRAQLSAGEAPDLFVTADDVQQMVSVPTVAEMANVDLEMAA